MHGRTASCSLTCLQKEKGTSLPICFSLIWVLGSRFAISFSPSLYLCQCITMSKWSNWPVKWLLVRHPKCAPPPKHAQPDTDHHIRCSKGTSDQTLRPTQHQAQKESEDKAQTLFPLPLRSSTDITRPLPLHARISQSHRVKGGHLQTISISPLLDISRSLPTHHRQNACRLQWNMGDGIQRQIWGHNEGDW